MSFSISSTYQESDHRNIELTTGAREYEEKKNYSKFSIELIAMLTCTKNSFSPRSISFMSNTFILTGVPKHSNSICQVLAFRYKSNPRSGEKINK